jgi:UDP-3-O-[3-hydroxymyristoyl] N-acetylglucosamine deacetylase/3-hydroxyacyl-[acyl-carrier-protein] dehydratase
MKQNTIKNSINIEGVGLHTGQVAKLTIHAATVNHGIKFKRVDLEGTPTIPATADYVVSTNRCTTIGKNDVTISTIEHLLAALTGLGIDNVLVEIDGGEVPILDGSAKPFVEALKNAAIEEQDADKDFVIIEEGFSFTDENTGTEFTLVPADKYSVTTLIDFDSPVLGKQFADLSDISDFENSVSTARTFAFLHEIEHLLENNLIKGGDLENAIVIVDRTLSEADIKRLEDKTGKSGIKVQQGILNTTKLRFSNEPARHKLLDVIGDLTLVGKPIQGKVIVSKPGHTANVALAKHLKGLYNKQRKLKGRPKYDPNQEPVYDVNKIASMR